MKRVLVIVGSVTIIVLGLILCLVTFAGLIFIALGAVLLVLTLRKPKQRPAAPVRRDPAPAPVPTVKQSAKPEGIPSAKPRKQLTCKISGVTYGCKNDSDYTRAEVLEDMSVGDPVVLESYEYQGNPAYLIVDVNTGLDIGNVPASVAETLSEIIAPVFECYISELDSFVNENDETVYYGKIKIFVI